MTDTPSEVDHYPPIVVKGVEHRAMKQWVRGTHRAMDPHLTLERIKPHLHKAGITRVADITGLDTVGIPVVIAVRPASGSLAVEAGKGATLEAAATSACMEAIERFVGEESPVTDVVGSPRQLADRLAVPAHEFPLMRHATVLEHREYSFTAMTNLVDGSELLAPSLLVALPPEQPTLSTAPWAASSNGLASGNHLPEALCAGLYEVIERDAVSSWEVAMRAGHQSLRVDLDTLEGEVIVGIVEQVRRSDSDVAILWNPTDIGVPSCTAFVWSKVSGMGVYKGYGCHLDPEIAMIRAVTEAVQARTVFVAGARDDLMRGAFEALKRSDVAGPEPMLANCRMVTVNDIPNRATGSFHGDVSLMLDDLARCGFTKVLARELDASAFGVSVCRVVVPGLEPYRFPWIAVSDRAKKFVPPTV
jgi:ribosomal protein S12 methylthiotransferase accessory factor